MIVQPPVVASAVAAPAAVPHPPRRPPPRQHLRRAAVAAPPRLPWPRLRLQPPSRPGAGDRGRTDADAHPAAAAAPTPAPPAGEHKEVTLDQETFDRVLAELLDKGTDRRVAEGQARRAAMIAARKKAEG